MTASQDPKASPAAGLPLPALLSQLLVAFTIEFDNEFEHQMPHRTTRGPAATSERGPWLVSMAMWANFLRFVPPDGIPLRDLREQAAWTSLAGLRRWRYIDLTGDRPADQIVTLARGGRRARAVWHPLAAAIEERWQARFGSAAVSRLRHELTIVADGSFSAFPHYLPVAGPRRQDWGPLLEPGRPRDPARDLAALLSQVLIGFTIDYERESRLSLAASSGVLRVITPGPVQLAGLPGRTGLAREAVDGAVTFLTRHQLAETGPAPGGQRGQAVTLTPRGERAQAARLSHLAATTEKWRSRFGPTRIGALTSAAAALLDARDSDRPVLAAGLEPYPDGWRAHPPYRAQTRAALRDPVAALPHYPAVSHRGGFPDGA